MLAPYGMFDSREGLNIGLLEFWFRFFKNLWRFPSRHPVTKKRNKSENVCGTQYVRKENIRESGPSLAHTDIMSYFVVYALLY